MKRLWLWPVAAAFVFASSATGLACGGGGGLKPHEAALLTDFLIYAIKPEGDDKDYKLVEIGDTKVDAGLLGVVINTLPLGFLGLGGDERTYDEGAEVAQCRAACSNNAECKSFTYVRPSAKNPVGVCHLKTLMASRKFGVMQPTSGEDAPGVGTTIEPPVREAPASVTPQAPAGRIVFDDTETFGAVRYSQAEARTTPLTLKFVTPVSQVKLLIRAGEGASERSWANVEARDAKGRVVERAGAWISAGEFSFGHGVAVSSGERDRIATVKIDARDGATLLIDSVEFVRTLIAPPVKPEAPVIATPTTPPPERAPPREHIPPPPRVPPIAVENFPLPPHAVPTASPTPITVPITPPVVAETPAPPAIETVAAAVEPPSEPSASAPTPVEDLVPAVAPPPQPKRQLPIWVALTAVAFLFGGAGVYWRSHRKRTLTRLSTRLVSSGLDRQTVAVGASSAPDINLRFVVRSAAAVGAPGTHIELVPARAPTGAYA